MADYATLKAAIQAVIYENGNQEITGSVMQATLLAMVNSLGANYQYAGIATPSTNPGTPDQNVFYLASTAGTYVNFGNIVLAENEVAILRYNGSWIKEASGFASAEIVSQLNQKVGDFNGRLDLPYGTPTASRYVNYTNGQLVQSGVNSAITGVDVSAYVGKTLYYSRARIPAAQGYQGMAFMKEDGTFLSGVQGVLNASVWGIELSSVTIPANAKTARFTCPTEFLSAFQCYVNQSIGQKIDNLEQREEALETTVSELNKIPVADTLSDKKLLTNASEWQNGMISGGGATSSSTNTICPAMRTKLQENAYVKVSVASGYKYRVLFFANYGTGTIVIPQTYPVIPGDYDDANVWHTEERILKLPSGASCYGITLRKIDGGNISTSDCNKISVSNTYGVEFIEDIPYLKSNLKFNSHSLLAKSIKSTTTESGITFEYEGDDSFHVSGTATNTVNRTLIGGNNVIPKGCEAGNTVYIAGMSNKVPFRVIEYVGGTPRSTDIFRPSAYKIGSDITAFSLIMVVRNGTTVDEHIRPVMLNSYSNEALYNSLADYIDSNKNLIDVNTAPASISHNGVTYTYDGNKWSVVGTASGTSWAIIAGSSRAIPSGIEIAKYIKAKFAGTNVALHIVQYDDTQTVIHSDMSSSDAIVAIDSQTRGVEIRLRVASGSTVNETVVPKIIGHLDDDDISKELFTLQHRIREDRIVQCAKSYYVMTRANKYTYGERSALYYGDGGELNQIHCGGITALLISGCSYYASRYAHPDSVNESYVAGYGFDFEAYSLKLVQAGNAAEIAYIGADNVNKTVEELKELMLFKTSYKLSISCLRWGMIKYIQSGGIVDTSKIKVGDILFYGNANAGGPQMVDGELITPVLIEGNLIAHCDTVISIENGVPNVIDAGSAPIRIHPFSMGSFTFVCVGRVPLFDIVI